VDKAGELRDSIASLDNFPDKPAFKELRTKHKKLKYSAGTFTIKQVTFSSNSDLFCEENDCYKHVNIKE